MKSKTAKQEIAKHFMAYTHTYKKGLLYAIMLPEICTT